MPEFRLRTYSATHGFRQQSLSAASEDEAREIAGRGGERVVALSRVVDLRRPGLLARSQKFALDIFSQELLTLLKAGLNLTEALDALLQRPRDEMTGAVLTRLNTLVGEGRSFSVALESMPDVFPVLYVAAIRSSETTGNMQEALARYLAYHRQINAVRDKVIAASIYPLILIAVSVLLMGFLFAYVIPRFARIYAEMGDRLPWASRLMLEWSRLLDAHGGIMLVVSVGLVSGIGLLLTRPSVKAAATRWIWQSTWLGGHLRNYQLARFNRTLAMLLSGGIPFMRSLGLVSDLLRQPALQVSLDQAIRLVGEGRKVSDVFAECGLASEIGARMLAAGERSGDLPGMLTHVAEMHDQELSRAVEWMSSMLEPILMIAVGLMIGAVVVLMYLPIFELASLAN